MKTALFTLITLSMFAAPAFAGEGGTTIKCQSASGKTTAEIYTSDGGDAEIRVSLANADGRGQTSVRYMNRLAYENAKLNNGDVTGAKIDPIVAISTNQTQAYVVVEIDNEGYDSNPIEVTSVPGTVRLKPGRYNGEQGTFRATLSGRDPRKTDGSYLNSITLNCTYDYSI